MGLISLLVLLAFCILIAYLVNYFINNREQKKSTYKNDGLSFMQLRSDKGRYGEYLSYRELEKLDGSHKLLNNLYIPLTNGSTTEIDLIMLDNTGVYVLESKNYSGWIFGDEKSRNWTQTFRNGEKYRFFNPIWQNRKHIKAIRTTLMSANSVFKNKELYKSYIVFSERCTLKKVSCHSSDVQILQRNYLKGAVMRERMESYPLLTDEEVNEAYYLLESFTEADDITKEKHIKQFQ
jgi:hypothetical protein